MRGKPVFDPLLIIFLLMFSIGNRTNARAVINGNSTEGRPVRSVIIRMINKIGQPRNGSPIC